jgi:hypothetical protein
LAKKLDQLGLLVTKHPLQVLPSSRVPFASDERFETLDVPASDEGLHARLPEAKNRVSR